MRCADPLRRGVSAPHQCPLESATSATFADVRLHIPMTHRNDAGTTDRTVLDFVTGIEAHSPPASHVSLPCAIQSIAVMYNILYTQLALKNRSQLNLDLLVEILQ